MNKKILIAIDSFIHNLSRASLCENLITQIKKVFPNYKILLINKSSNDYGLQSKVDYYLNLGNGFMVGYPPPYVLENFNYSKPYVYRATEMGIVENWMPLTGVTDHVAGIFNSFVVSSKFAENLKFDKIFKIEFDTDFDLNELSKIKNEVENFEDFLFYGRRFEGNWCNPNYYLIDTHICGYSTKLLYEFSLLESENDFWDLCEKIGYHGKWIEYIIPRIYEFNKERMNLKGAEVNGKLREVYPKTNFDVINSDGFWVDKWIDVPKMCRLSLDKGISELKNKIGLFFYNEKNSFMEVETQVYKNSEIVENFNYQLEKDWWSFHEVEVDEQIRIVSKYETSDGFKFSYEKTLELENIKNLNCRMIYS